MAGTHTLPGTSGGGATGWVAASFDQLYVLFLLLGAALVVRLPDDTLLAQQAPGSQGIVVVLESPAR